MIYKTNNGAAETSKVLSVLLCLTLLFNITAVRMTKAAAIEAGYPESVTESAEVSISNESAGSVSRVITDESGKVSVEGMLPDGAEVVARALTDEEIAELTDGEELIAFAYDITIMLEGSEYQPSEPVTVSIEPDMDISGEVSVEHIMENPYGGESVHTDVEAVNEDGSIIFDAPSFSVYIGTVVYDYSITMKGGAGIRYYSDAACTQELTGPKGGYFSSALDIYVKLDPDCALDSISVTDEDCGSGAGSYSSVGNGVYKVSFPSGLPSSTKNQVIDTRLVSQVIEFDLAKGNVALSDSGYSGTDSAGGSVTGAHVPSNKYIISQSGSGTTAHTIKVGTTSVCVEKDFIVYLNGINVNIPSGRTEMPIYVNNNGNVYLILKDNKTNTVRITCGTSAVANSNDHAAIEKELSNGSVSNGELVITCEHGYEAYTADDTKGHDCAHSGTCGALKAYGANAYEEKFIVGTSGTAYIHGAAAIGSKAAGYTANNTNDTGFVSGHINITDFSTTYDYCLKNLIIAGGDIYAKSGAGGTTFNGGGAGIGTGAGPDPAASGNLKPTGPAVVGMRFTGGYVEAVGSSGSTACIGGGYRSNDIHIDFYGGTIKAETRWKTDNSTNQSNSGIPKGAGIGSGGGGGSSGSCSKTYINIYGGDITAKSVKGAAIGNSSGGDGDTSTYGKTCSLYACVNIYGGTVDARTTGVGPGIGSGGLVGQGQYMGQTGDVDINISGGTVYAYSAAGADIGSGGMAASNESYHKNTKAGKATVTITGGNITAPNGGIGGGAVHSGTGGDADIIINAPDGFINAKSIGGGASVTGNGGLAKVTVNAGAPTVDGTIGGGSSSSGSGGKAEVIINGGTLDCGTIGGGLSSTGAGGNAEVKINGGSLECDSIGGGNSTSSSSAEDGGEAKVIITDGTLNVSGGIGGGRANGSGRGGEAVVTVSGGSLFCESIGGGDCGASGHPGAAEIEVSQAPGKTTSITTGYIGGGAGDGGDIGYATAVISGGSIQGQFIMASTDPTSPSSFTMTGGTIDNTDLGAYGSGAEYAMKMPNGGAVYMDDTNGIADISGGTITNGNADLGGAVYMTSGTLSLSGTAKITECSANDEGGAVYLGGGSLTMQGGSVTDCTAQSGGAVYMTSGTLDISGSAKISECEADNDGGGIYLGGGTLTMQGGSVEDCSAQSGGGVYMTSGELTVSGSADISGCEADNMGGGVYLGGGELALQGGTVEDCSAQTGGGIYVNGGSLSMSGGTVDGCSARNGGGFCVDDGSFEMSGGSLINNTSSGNGGGGAVNGGSVIISGGSVGGPGSGNTASDNGGGIYVHNGSLLMSAGSVDYNKALNGSGGGIFVSAEGQDVDVAIYSGSVSHNTAAVSGGAMSVEGDKNAPDIIRVVIGVDHDHSNMPFDHTGFDSSTYNHPDCPHIEDNHSQVSGGGVLVRGGVNTSLNIYCLVEDNNKVGDTDSRSEFMMVEGGKVNVGDNNDGEHGCNIDITGTIYVTGGQVDIWGGMENPKIEAPTTVDITSQDDYFHDHRPENSGTSYKLLYFENFLDPSTGVVTGQYTAYQIEEDEEVQISGVIYNHPGYEILGWWTNRDGTGTKYTVGETLTLTADLTIYAIWEAHGYTVRFDPNVPPNTPFGTEMPDETFNYSESKPLSLNTYSYTGHVFTGWNTKADGTGDAYSDGEEVQNLTEEDLATVILYAQWDDCTHQNEQLIYSLEGTDTIRRDCSCGSLTQKITVSALDAVYDGNAHAASISMSGPDVPEWVAPEIVYYKVADGTETQLDGAPVNAGDYIARITSHNVTAQAEYTIAKAPQDPPERPTVALSGDKITAPAVADNTANGTQSMLQLSYKVGSEQELSAPHLGADGYEFTLDNAWTDYVVLAYYDGNENYLPSEKVAANHIFYQGNTEITVVCGEGVSAYTHGDDQNGNGVIIDYSILEGYYKPDDFSYTVSVDGVDETQTQNSGIVITHDPAANSLRINNISTSIGTIVIELSDARKAVTLSAKADNGEVFGTVTGTHADISRDSAFTLYFEARNYTSSEYPGLQLDFGGTVPQGTTVIFIDRSVDGETTWWSHTASSDETGAAMTEFVRMGTASQHFSPTDGTLKYQFIIDFSDTATGCAGTLAPTLNANKRSSSEPDFPVISESLVTLRDAPVFSLSANSTGRLTGIINYTYTPSQGYASKWLCRGSAIVISADGLPSDAYLRTVTPEGATNRYSVDDGSGRSFIIPLGELGSGTVTVTLCSDMFPSAAAEYDFDSVRWMISGSATGSYPMNGTEAASASMTLSKNTDNIPSLKITGDRILYSLTDTVEVDIDYNSIPVGSTINLSLQRKGDNGVFAGTGTECDITAPGRVQVSLGGQQTGSFCIRVTVKNGMNRILDVPYYFTVQ